MSTDTPRTDAAIAATDAMGGTIEDFARQLERELAEAKEKLNTAIRLCSVPERSQDDEWYRDFDRISTP